MTALINAICQVPGNRYNSYRFQNGCFGIMTVNSASMISRMAQISTRMT